MSVWERDSTNRLVKRESKIDSSQTSSLEVMELMLGSEHKSVRGWHTAWAQAIS